MRRADSGRIGIAVLADVCGVSRAEGQIAGRLQAEAVARSAIFAMDYITDERTPARWNRLNVRLAD
jgi:hypothetical protein